MIAQPQQHRLRRGDRAAGAGRELGGDLERFLLQLGRRHDQRSPARRPSLRARRSCRPVSSRSRVSAGPIRSTIRAVFAIDRQLPSVRDTGTPKRARSEQMRRSHAMAIAQPPPAAAPSTSAMVAIGSALDAIDHRVEPPLVGDAVIAAAEVAELRNVGAGRERAARSAYDEHAHVRVGLGRVAGLDQRVVHLPRQRVARLGAIQRHTRNGSVDVPGDIARWHSGSRCDPGDGRAVLRDVTGGHGRARHQSGAARRRLDAQHGRRQRQRQRGVQRRQSRQARHRHRSQSPSRAAASSSGSPARADILVENYRPGRDGSGSASTTKR